MTTREPYRPQRVGNLRERVAIQQRTVTQSHTGEEIEAWTLLAEVWARVEPLKGEEKFAASQIIASQRFNIHIRQRDDVTVLDRVQWNGLDLNIAAISNPDERGRYTQLDCVANV